MERYSDIQRMTDAQILEKIDALSPNVAEGLDLWKQEYIRRREERRTTQHFWLTTRTERHSHNRRWHQLGLRRAEVFPA